MELASSLERMTSRLRADEEALRDKIAEVGQYAGDLKVAQDNLVRSERLASVGPAAPVRRPRIHALLEHPGPAVDERVKQKSAGGRANVRIACVEGVFRRDRCPA